MTLDRRKADLTGPPGARAVWDRLHWQIRCGLPPLDPARVRLYLHVGSKLARRSGDPLAGIHLRMLRNLVATALDEVLSATWRAACMEHVAVPLAVLSTQIGLREPLAFARIEADVEAAFQSLQLRPDADVRR